MLLEGSSHFMKGSLETESLQTSRSLALPWINFGQIMQKDIPATRTPMNAPVFGIVY